MTTGEQSGGKNSPTEQGRKTGSEQVVAASQTRGQDAGIGSCVIADLAEDWCKLLHTKSSV